MFAKKMLEKKILAKKILAKFNRINLLIYVFILLFCIISVRLSYFSIKGYFVNKVHNSNNINKTRYDIVDRNGLPLALSVPISSVYINPTLIKNKQVAIIALSESLHIPVEVANNLVNMASSFVWVKRNITAKEELSLKYYGVVGIFFATEKKRVYPYNSLFSHIVGMTDTDGNGVSGVENSFNNELYQEPVKLSLDIKLQQIMHDALSKAKENNQAKRAYGMIVNPKNGEVLASVSLPDFDPNTRENLNYETAFNYPTQAVLELGSIIKIFSFAMALDSKTTRFTDVFDVSKPIVVNPFVITDFSYITKEIVLPEAFMYSSNIATAIMIRRLGVENHKAYLEHFKLFGKSSLEINENEKSLQPLKWNDLTSMIMSYGYGFAVSQASYMNAFISIIDNGTYKPITLLKRTNNNYETYRIISVNVSKQINAMMRLNVAFGSGSRANLPGFAVAGKTGSSDKLLNGKYSLDKTIASFAAFFPYNDPQYAIIISIDEPIRNAYNRYVITGGILAAPVMAEIIEKITVAEAISQVDDSMKEVDKNDAFSLLQFVSDAK